MDYYRSKAPISADQQQFTSNIQRSLIACNNCRQSKTRCNPPPDGKKQGPCERCARKALRCQFVEDRSHKADPQHASAQGWEPTQQGYPQAPHSAPIPQAGSTRNLLVIPEHVPDLPYTGPPPASGHPRYADGRYPNLGLETSPGLNISTNSAPHSSFDGPARGLQQQIPELSWDQHYSGQYPISQSTYATASQSNDWGTYPTHNGPGYSH